MQHLNLLFQLNLHSPLTSSASSSSEVITTIPKFNPNRLKRHYSFSHSTTSSGSRSKHQTNPDPESMVRRLGMLKQAYKSIKKFSHATDKSFTLLGEEYIRYMNPTIYSHMHS